MLKKIIAICCILSFILLFFIAYIARNTYNPMAQGAAAWIAMALQSSDNEIVPVGDVQVSRTGIAFSLENRTDLEFTYGAPWYLAYYSNGRWLPVRTLRELGNFAWTMQSHMLQGGGIQSYRQNWEWRFGYLQPGRYMFIRDGWLGDLQDQYWVYAFVEFTITADSPAYLPPQVRQEPRDFIDLVEFGDVTPGGMRIVISNISAYDIDDHSATISFIIPERYAISNHWWEWQQHLLPMLPVEGYWRDYLTHEQGFLPSGGQLEFQLDWSAAFGELPPDEYRIEINLSGRARPPHPTGRAFKVLTITFTV